MRIFSLLAIMIYCFELHAQNSRLIINEFMASNDSAFSDEFGEYDDWIEIWNYSSDTAYDIAGYYLTDDLNQPKKWKIPSDTNNNIILPDSFLIIWLDNQTEQGALHADFKIDKEGEQIGLFEKDGVYLIDGFTFSHQYTDTSYGRDPSNSNQWLYFSVPTPGKPNSESSGYKGFSPDVIFSLNGGRYATSVNLNLSSEEPSNQHKIYYSTDGANPDSVFNMRYLNELTIDSTMTIRARVYQEGYFPGPIQTNTYIINDPSELPIIAITTNPPNLWDEHTGIYVRGPIADPDDRWDKRANWWQDWEKPAHLEYFNTNNEEWFDTDIKIKIFGGYTRASPKKSFTILKKYFNRAVFESKPQIQVFDGFVLRSTRLNRPNELIYEINHEEGRKVDIQAYKHVSVYLNGKYWGLYNFMERKNDEFIEMNHGYSDIDMIEGITISQGPWIGDISVVDGSMDNYLELLAYTNDHDLSNDENFNLIREWIDVENFIDFWIYEIFISKNDQVNIRFWRPKEPTGKWRWISFDFDFLRGYEDNTLQRIYNEYPAYWWWLLASYLRNTGFRNEFIIRFSDLLNTRFHQKNLMPLFLNIESSISNELEKDLIRWKDSDYNAYVYNWHYNWMIDFINERVSYVRDDILETFNIEKQINLQLENSDTTFGKISLNSITINESQWEGIYFKDIPVTLVAVPNDSGRFIGWADSTGIISYSDSLEIALERDQYFKAMFTLNTSRVPNNDLVPEAYNLHQNYPNPFNNVTLVTFDLPETTKVKLSIYNSIGQKIETLINSKMVAGKHSVLLNAKNYSSGIYYYQLLTSKFKHAKKMILLR